MALDFVCGAECRIVTAGGGAAPDARVWSSINGTPTISTTTVRSGAASFRFNPSAATAYLNRAIARTAVSGRFYVRWATLPGATVSFFQLVNASGSLALKVSSAGDLFLDIGAGSDVGFGTTVSTGIWYRIDFRADTSTGTADLRARLDGGTEGSTTQAQASANMTAVRFGNPQTAATTDIFFDDLVFGDDVADYPIGAGEVEGISPTADGTHSFTAGDFGYNTAGGDVSTSATDVFSFVDDSDLSSTSDLIRQKVVRSTGYVEVQGFNATHTTDPRIVGVNSSWHASATGANTVGLHLMDGATEAVVTDDAGDDLSDFSNTSITFDFKGYATKPSGGAWTLSALEALTVRMGYSTDVVGIPYWDGIMLEADFPDPVADTRVPKSSPYPQMLPH